MCVTTSRSILDNTYIGSWDIDHPTLGYRHVLCYQNRVSNLSKSPNCMLLPVQSSTALDPGCLVNTSDHPDVLTDLYNIINPIKEDNSDWMSARSGDTRPVYVVTMGVYHVALLNDPSMVNLKLALEQIPEHKRPSIPARFIRFYQEHYDGYPLLLCCFNNAEAEQASPIMVHYTPIRKDRLMFNTLDAHGALPDMNEALFYHQKVIIGTSDPVPSESKAYQTVPEDFYGELQPYLPKVATTMDLHGCKLPNQDMHVNLSDVKTQKVPETYFGLSGGIQKKVDLKLHELKGELMVNSFHP